MGKDLSIRQGCRKVWKFWWGLGGGYTLTQGRAGGLKGNPVIKAGLLCNNLRSFLITGKRNSYRITLLSSQDFPSSTLFALQCSINVVVIICHPFWNMANWSANIWGGGDFPLPPVPTGLLILFFDNSRVVSLEQSAVMVGSAWKKWKTHFLCSTITLVTNLLNLEVCKATIIIRLNHIARARESVSISL